MEFENRLCVICGSSVDLLPHGLMPRMISERLVREKTSTMTEIVVKKSHER